MNDEPKEPEAVFERIKEIVTVSTELAKLKFADTIAETLSGLFPGLVATSLIIFFFLFGTLGLAFWLGDLFGRLYLGFLSVSGFYLILGLTIGRVFRTRLKKIASDFMIRQFFK